jgi:hypothetical protein
MFKNALLATVAAALLSAGAVALSTGTAEAHGYGYGYAYQGGYYVTQAVEVPQTVYKTYYKTVISGYDNCYNPIYAQVPYTASETVYVTEYEKVFAPYSHNSYGYAPAQSYGY